jgi:hypothetical protein
MARLDKRQISVVLIDKMFELAGHDVRFKDVEGRQDHWYEDWTMTEEQNKEWRDWGTKFIKTQCRLNKNQADVEMALFDLNYGLKIKNK